MGRSFTVTRPRYRSLDSERRSVGASEAAPVELPCSLEVAVISTAHHQSCHDLGADANATEIGRRIRTDIRISCKDLSAAGLIILPDNPIMSIVELPVVEIVDLMSAVVAAAVSVAVHGTSVHLVSGGVEQRVDAWSRKREERKISAVVRN